MFHEPVPPTLSACPPGTKDLFERRQAALPIGRIHTKIGGEALMSNEAQVVNRFERAHGLTWEERAPLSTWHMRAVHQRISEQKPDLIWPVRPTGFSSGVRAATRKDRLMFTLGRWHLWNFLSGTHCWIRNRMIEVRVALFRASGNG